MTTMRSFFRFLKPSTSIGIVIFAFSACSSSTTPQASPAVGSFPPVYAELLQKYATPTGVRYAAWHKNAGDLKKLKGVTDFYATTTPPVSSKEANLAWHLNAYNAWILQNVFAKYPTKGPLDESPQFFDQADIVISGSKTSFNHFEQKVIRPTFQDPRVHFALNCASTSCPPLHVTPFAAETLDADLDRLASAFINSDAVQVTYGNQTVRVSKIFDWYAADFGGKENVLAYVNQYRTSKLPDSSELAFLDYDWSLNEAK